jgi:predicted transcriptional regulator
MKTKTWVQWYEEAFMPYLKLTGSQSDVLLLALTKMDIENMFEVSQEFIDELNEAVAKKRKPYQNTTVAKALLGLTGQNMIKRTKRNNYWVNPRYFYINSTKARGRAIGEYFAW